MTTLHRRYGARESGLLLPFRSLPGNQDYQGTYGPDAERFLEVMRDAGFSVLHDLPNTPPDSYGCPYSSVSASALDTQRIGLEQLAHVGDITAAELDEYQSAVAMGVPAPELAERKQALLQWAFVNFDNNAAPERKRQFAAWRENEAEWLEPYAAFELLKKLPANQGNRWQDWKIGKDYSPELVANLRESHGREFNALCYSQWIAEQQTLAYLEKAKQNNIEIWGDVPFYVGAGEVWANRRIFNLDDFGSQINQGGAPPSATSATGQVWGNATYKIDPINHPIATAGAVDWWVKRLKRAQKLNGGKVRLDHFIGFAEPYIIAAGAPDGMSGWREDGMGDLLFERLAHEFGGTLPFYPEDLGEMTHKTPELRDKYEMLSTALAVRGLTKELLRGDYAIAHNNPDNYHSKSVAFSGNHDSLTLVHALNTIRSANPREFAHYVGILNGRFPGASFETSTPTPELAQFELHRIVGSVGRYAILAMWDVIGTDAITQYNKPGVVRPENWVWRMDSADMLRFTRQAPQWKAVNEATSRTLREAA